MLMGRVSLVKNLFYLVFLVLIQEFKERLAIEAEKVAAN